MSFVVTLAAVFAATPANTTHSDSTPRFINVEFYERSSDTYHKVLKFDAQSGQSNSICVTEPLKLLHARSIDHPCADYDTVDLATLDEPSQFGV